MRTANEQYALIGRRMNILYHLRIATREVKKVSLLWDEIILSIKAKG